MNKSEPPPPIGFTPNIYFKISQDRPNKLLLYRDYLVPADHENRVLFYNDTYDKMERVENKMPCYMYPVILDLR